MPLPTLPTLSDTAVEALAAEAGLAPSLHNAQPWRFRYTRATRVFALYADPARRLPRIDPDDRGLHLGCGAALLNLRVAVAARGWRPETALLPGTDEPHLLATVRLAAVDGSRTLAALHPAVAERHTSRYPFWDTDISPALVAELRAAAGQEGVDLHIATGRARELVLELSRVAAAREAADPARQEDLMRWTHIGAAAADTAVEGIPDHAFGPRERGGRAPVRDLAAGRPGAAHLGATDFEESPFLALLSTPSDTPVDWLRAGQALERVLLDATRQGLAGSPVTQALEWADLRAGLSDALPEPGHLQLVLRLGRGPLGPRTPRRRAREALEIAD